MKRLFRRLRHEQRGFTLIELLIVIAILGIIAAIVVPNVSGFMTSGKLNAANTEVQNVKTAAVGYLAENGKWPTSSNDLVNFLEGGIDNLKATYSFDKNEITTASPVGEGWGSIYWCRNSQTWVRDASACSGGGGEEGGE
jgi:prepilin-type N-terminal cleavage/methylation domain-containing protein